MFNCDILYGGHVSKLWLHKPMKSPEAIAAWAQKTFKAGCTVRILDSFGWEVHSFVIKE